MCYLIVRDSKQKGCYAFKTEFGEELADYSEFLEDEYIKDNLNIELVTLSRPSAYGEYEPYQMVKTKEEFTNRVKNFVK